MSATKKLLTFFVFLALPLAKFAAHKLNGCKVDYDSPLLVTCKSVRSK